MTVGQPAAVSAVHAMIATHVPHAILLAGPASVGKTSLALDLAAALLCTGADAGARPCRSCRSCRMVAHGNHPDLHMLEPEGPGGQVGIGGKDGKRGVRDLVTELALLPVEGVARVAIVRDAHRMNEDAQSALLKTLEEPHPGTTIILCADDDERLLPTVRSRCARVRLGTVGPRDVELLLAQRELADAPTAARLARLAGGRPGLAVAYATRRRTQKRSGTSSPEPSSISSTRARRHACLRQRRWAHGPVRWRPSSSPPPDAGDSRARVGRGPAHGRDRPQPSPRRRMGNPALTPPQRRIATRPPASRRREVSASERRRAMAVLLDAWRDVARDLTLAQLGASRSIRDVALIEEVEAAARDLPDGAASMALARLVRATELLEANVSPELVLDVLLVRWPRRRRAA